MLADISRDPGRLDTEWHKCLHDYYWAVHHRCLGESLWSNIGDLALFKNKFVWQQSAGFRCGSSSGQTFKISGEQILQKLNACECSLNGADLGFGEVRRQWENQSVRVAYKSRKGVAELGIFATSVPPQVLYLMVAKVWPVWAVPYVTANSKIQKQQALYLSGKANLDPVEAEYPGDRNKMVQLCPRKFAAAASLIRNETHIENEEFGCSKLDILSWLDVMSEHTDGRLKGNLQSKLRSDKKAGYAVSKLILACKMGGLLRQDQKLQQAVRVACALIGLSCDWLQWDCALPSASLISSARFTLDCAFALCMQAYWEQLLIGEPFWVYLTCDSSPRSGREWLFLQFWIVLQSDAVKFFLLMKQLIHLRTQPIPDLAEIARLSRQMNGLIRVHVLLPVCVGARNLSLAAKFAAAIHSIRMECASWISCQQVISRIIQVLTDYGVESLFSTVPPYDVASIYPHWFGNVREPEVLDDSCFECGPCDAIDGVISMSGAIPTPGIEHICNNGLSQIGKKLTYFASWLKAALQCARYFGSRYYRSLVLDQLEKIHGSEKLRRLICSATTIPLEHRFGAIMDWILEFLPMRADLPAMVSFGCKRSASDLDGEKNDDHVNIALVSASIADQGFWVYTLMISLIGGCFYCIQNLSRSCDCHRAKDIDLNDVDTYAKRARAAAKESGQGPCVAKGIRVKDFSSNVAEAMLETRFRTFKYELLVQCKGVSAKRRDEIMADFDSGCQYVLYVTGVKLAVYLAPPISLAGTAALDDEQCRQNCRKLRQHFNCVDIDRHHRTTVAYLSPGVPFGDQMDQFIAGTPADDLTEFHEMRCVFGLMRSNEIPAESLHKVGSDLGDHASYLSESYVSCGLRAPEMWNNKIVSLEDLGDAFLRTRTAQQVLGEFGLEEHPLVKERKDSAVLAGKDACRALSHRDIRSIFYRSDSVSMYNKAEEYRAFIKKQSDLVAANLLACQEAPMHAVPDTLAEQRNAVESRYMMELFKDRVCFS